VSLYRVTSAYAKSLIELSQEQKSLEKVYEDMVFVSNTIEGSFELKNLLSSPVISNLKKLSIIEALFKSRISDLTFGFFSLLTKKKREDLLFAISKEFIAAYKVQKGIQLATVVTAIAADDVLKNQIGKLAKTISAKEIETTYKVDTSIIGGFILTVGDKQIDNSVKSQLNKVKNQFSNNPFIPKY
jgi:F-type H+-transporting ATPase subunit delta